MLKNSYKLLFYMTLIMGTLIAISSNTWFSCWMGLEINLLSFIPLMNDNKNLLSSEASLKYFLIQALASSILLFMTTIYLMIYNYIPIYDDNYLKYMININIMSTLMLKSGMAPFHFWFPNIISGLNWLNSFILLTWQKIAPLMLISYVLMDFLLLATICSLLVGAIGSLNQTSLQKILAYSSISHLSWMGATMASNNLFWMNYFIFYSFLTMILVMYFYFYKLFFINQLFSMFNNSIIMKLVLFLNFLSLGGLPPFLGFWPKWITIQILLNSNQLLILFLMTTITLITLFVYIRMSYSSFLINYFENKWNLKSMYKSKFLYLYFSLSFISIFSLPIINIFYYLL